jgi:tetratricopeptide (TPR) repeat protein
VALTEFLPSSDETAFLAAYHRFVVGAALRLVPWPRRARLLGVKIVVPPGDKSRREWHEGPAWTLPTQKSINAVPLDRDPLHLLRRLHIARFLTTNYDLEIEACFIREGLTKHQVEMPVDEVRDPLAKHWRHSSFDRDHVGHLLSFVARDGRRVNEVVHLHGRAEAHEHIIVTNADYQSHYLTVDDKRAGMDAAVAAAFGGHPILFVGSGMGEDDLLRPLRQFVGEKAPSEGCLAIAIVPAANAKGDRAISCEKLNNLQRYGVYTIHTGDADIGHQLPPANYSGDVPRLWLTRLAMLKETMDKALRSGKPKSRFKVWREVTRHARALFGKTTLATPRAIEKIEVSAHPALDLRRELGIFNATLTLAERIQRNASYWSAEVADAFRYALEGSMQSIIGAFLCARLLRMEADRTAFSNQWLRLPNAEDPLAVARLAIARERADPPPADELETEPIWSRHSLALAPSPNEQPSPEAVYRRFYAGAPSQTFNDLREALSQAHVARCLLASPTGRRIFIFLGNRGYGRGHFFAALSRGKRLGQLRSCLGNTKSQAAWPAIFFNCGLSHEVTSIFDSCAQVMIEAAKEVQDAWQYLHQRTSEDQARSDELKKLERTLLRNDRIGRLSQVLNALGTGGILPPGQRIILGIHGLGVLFDRDGRAKNAQIQRLFDVLLRTDGAPLDLVLVSSEARLPEVFRASTGLAPTRDGKLVDKARRPLRLITNANWSAKTRRDMESRGLLVAPEPLSDASMQIPAGNQKAFAYFLRPTRASIMAISYFPSVALVIAVTALDGIEGTRRTYDPRQFHRGQFHRETAAETRFWVKAVFDSAEPGPEGGTTGSSPKELALQIMASAALKCASPDKPWHEKVFIRDSKGARLKAKPRSRDEPLVRAIDERMRGFFGTTGESRYGFTLLMSTAYQFLVPVAERKNTTGAGSQDPAVAVSRCSDFLLRAQNELDITPRERRVEAVIEITMRTLAALDADPNIELLQPWATLKKAGPSEFFAFQRTVLWQLAVIGQPVNAEVIARSPAVLRFYKTYTETESTTNDQMTPVARKEAQDELWFDAIKGCLELLEHRCLVFFVRPHVFGVPDPSTSYKRGYRYAIHAQLQRYIFRPMHSPFIEYPEVDQFAVTLFAHQANDLPRLTSLARQELHLAVGAMIGHPGASQARFALSSWPALPPADNRNSKERKRILTVRAQLLRAALGILRSVYSIATIARAVNPPSIRGEAVKRPVSGVLEQHCSQVHWMIEQAKRLDAQQKALESEGGTSTYLSRPFYAEEIAWLYNEAGVLSYARGRMLEASSFFQRADHAVGSRIEPSADGAVRTRIALNWALVDIDRGRLDVAEARLQRILRIADEQPVIRRLAAGFLGLVEHIRGRYQAASTHYEVALLDGCYEDQSTRLGLVTLNRTRAASIISRHYGDLMRTLGSRSKAERMLAQSATLAIEGGHEDIRHETRLSMLRLKIRGYMDGQEVHSPNDRHLIHKELDVIEDFALQMGMPRLQCDADLVRAELHQLDGDLTTALAVASRGLTTASANDLRLRKTRFLLRLSELFEQRGRLPECREVLGEAFELARETQYHSAREQGQGIAARISTRSS